MRARSPKRPSSWLSSCPAVRVGVVLPVQTELSKACPPGAFSGREAPHGAWHRIGPGAEQVPGVCMVRAQPLQRQCGCLWSLPKAFPTRLRLCSCDLGTWVEPECWLVWPLILWGKNRHLEASTALCPCLEEQPCAGGWARWGRSRRHRPWEALGPLPSGSVTDGF